MTAKLIIKVCMYLYVLYVFVCACVCVCACARTYCINRWCRCNPGCFQLLNMLAVLCDQTVVQMLKCIKNQQNFQGIQFFELDTMHGISERLRHIYKPKTFQLSVMPSPLSCMV